MDSKFRYTTWKSTNEYPNSGVFPHPIVPTNRRDTRICRIRNYVPHKTPRYTSLENWSRCYIIQLIDIFNIIKETIVKSPLYKTINWESQVIYHNLYKLIYHLSSKYILPDLRENYDSDYDSS